MERKSQPITKSQKELMADFISNKKEMYVGKLTPTYTKEVMTKNWQELANQLNSVPQGPAKDWRQWRKTWVDIKKNSKARAVREKRYMEGTGGGPPLVPPPNPDDIDVKILNLIPTVTITGDQNIVESAVEFDIPMEDICNNEEVEDVHNNEKVSEHFDHSYINEDVKKRHDESLQQIVEPTVVMQKAKRLTKSMRLEKSLEKNDRFLNLNKEKIDSDRMYQNRKLALLELDINNKKMYRDLKLVALQEIASGITQIAKDAREICNVRFKSF